MKTFSPTVARVNKQFDKHGKLESVEFFYLLTSQQRILLENIIVLWAGKTFVSNFPRNHEELTKVMRIVLRTKEYSEKYQDALKEIRSWYIDYKNNKL